MKSKNKYKNIKKACKINDKIFLEIINNFKFKTERDIADYIKKRFKDFKVNSAFTPIVANNNSIIHAKPRKIELTKGFCIIDFGSRVNKYSSDMTRTIFLGKATKQQKELYKIILNCQKKCIKEVKIGKDCKELDLYSRKLLGKYKRYYTHALGHGVGYRIHMLPKITPNSKNKLKESDVITIEPGVYIKQKNKEFGIRIEDTINVNEKIEILSNSPKNLIEIKNESFR